MEEIVLTSKDSNLNSHYKSVIGGFAPASHTLMTFYFSVIISFSFLF